MGVAMPGTVDVVQWAQERGEIGGVLTSHLQLTAQLQAEGRVVRYVDTGSLRRAVPALRGLWRHRCLHLLHITRLWRAAVLAPVLGALPGRCVLVLHSGSVGRQLSGMRGWRSWGVRAALHAYDEIWAVNGEIATQLPKGLARRVRVVTPFSPPVESGGTHAPSRDATLVSVSTNAGQPHYNTDLALEAVRLVRERRPEMRLRILAYGHDGAGLGELRRKVSDVPWVQLTFDASSAEVADVLRRSAVFLRPTSWDGDSVVVREAVALGTRVVASDVAPRPAGVELASLDAESFALAVLEGGRLSDGSGLAEQSLLQAAVASLALVRPAQPS